MERKRLKTIPFDEEGDGKNESSGENKSVSNDNFEFHSIVDGEFV